MGEAVSKKCSFCEKEGSFSKVFEKTLCPKHYYQIKTYGKIINSKYDSNKVVTIDEETFGLICFNSKHEETGVLLIDKEDYEKVKSYRWRMDKKGYGYNNSNKNIYIHNLILPHDETEIVDHIDGNPKNNKKSNLRVVKKYFNNLNKAIKKDNSSGVTGVNKHKKLNKWRSRINFNKKEITLGMYDKFEEAVCKRMLYEFLLFGEMSRHYNYSEEYFGMTFFDKDDLKTKTILIPKHLEVPKLSIKEVTVEDILAVDSERGTGALGSSGK